MIGVHCFSSACLEISAAKVRFSDTFFIAPENFRSVKQRNARQCRVFRLSKKSGESWTFSHISGKI